MWQKGRITPWHGWDWGCRGDSGEQENVCACPSTWGWAGWEWDVCASASATKNKNFGGDCLRKPFVGTPGPQDTDCAVRLGVCVCVGEENSIDRGHYGEREKRESVCVYGG